MTPTPSGHQAGCHLSNDAHRLADACANPPCPGCTCPRPPALPAERRKAGDDPQARIHRPHPGHDVKLPTISTPASATSGADVAALCSHHVSSCGVSAACEACITTALQSAHTQGRAQGVEEAADVAWKVANLTEFTTWFVGEKGKSRQRMIAWAKHVGQSIADEIRALRATPPGAGS